MNEWELSRSKKGKMLLKLSNKYLCVPVVHQGLIVQAIKNKMGVEEWIKKCGISSSKILCSHKEE